MYRPRSKPPKKVRAKAIEDTDRTQPAYLSEEPFNYVNWVLERQSTTVDALVEAGLSEAAIRYHCLAAVFYARELPESLAHHRTLVERTNAALPALHTVRTLVEALFLITITRVQTSGGGIKIWDANEINNCLDYLEQEARRYKKVDPTKLGIAPEAGQKSLSARRWSAVRTAIGVLAFLVRHETASTNTTLVSNLCGELFLGAAPNTWKTEGRAIDEEVVRRCLKSYDKTNPEFEFESLFRSL